MPSDLPQARTRQALQDMRDNARLARRFAEGLSEAAFATDLRTLYAVVRCLEIVSEASRRIDAETQARHPALPWRAISAAGNIYRQEYGNLTPGLVWRTVQDSLPVIIAVAEVELARLEEE